MSDRLARFPRLTRAQVRVTYLAAQRMATEDGHAWSEVATPGVSTRAEELATSARTDQGRSRQHRGV